MGFFFDHLLLVPTIAWVVAVIFKGAYGLLAKNFSLSQALGSGGMPSVHAALVTSLSTAIGIKYGIMSDIFAVSLVFTAIIIYDAINVRFEAGLHARVLNSLSDSEDRALNESIGHLPDEAFVGSVVGIAVAVACMSV